MTSVQPLRPREQPIVGATYHAIGALGRSRLGDLVLAAVAGPPGLERLACITSFSPELTESPAVVDRFIAAAHGTLRFRHPNIVRTFEVGVDVDAVLAPSAVSMNAPQKRCFVATEYIAGQPLGRILHRLSGTADFTLQLRLEIVTDILAALAYAHDRAEQSTAAVGHGDLRPDNILVGYDGQVKVAHFGLARALLCGADGDLPRFIPHLAYLAPEQLRGHPGDRRSDLFAVGMLLWEMLAERPMFEGRCGFDVMSALAGPTPFPALPDGRGIPPALARICHRALARDPAARYQLATDFRRDLEDLVISELPAEARALGKVISHAFRADKATAQSLVGRFAATQAPPEDDDEEIVSQIISQVELMDGTLDPLSLRSATVTPAIPPIPPALPGAVPSYLADRITGSLPALELTAEGSAARAADAARARARLPLMIGALFIGAAITFVVSSRLRPTSGQTETPVSATSVGSPPALPPVAMDRAQTEDPETRSAPGEPDVPARPADYPNPKVPAEPLPARRRAPRPAGLPEMPAATSAIDPESPYRP